jgi:hypothetical protein
LLALSACGEAGRDARGEAEDPAAARRAVQACGEGDQGPDCEAARARLAEARRRDRMAAYEQAF